MKRIIAAAVVAAMVPLLFCGPVRSTVQHWLDSKRTTPGFDITGRWDSGSAFSGGWGGVTILQTGDRLVGTMGAYNIEGVVSGTDVYMMMASGGRVYYTAKLSRRPDGTVAGIAVERAIVDTPGASGAAKYPVILKMEQEQ
ncbi:MAG: hypothetical protein JXA20_14215 [Spirochaetes bacterium]|nr:hypothetical protein [Spirochaetota bacterium]